MYIDYILSLIITDLHSLANLDSHSKILIMTKIVHNVNVSIKMYHKKCYSVLQYCYNITHYVILTIC